MDFSEINNNRQFRWLLNEHNKPCLRVSYAVSDIFEWSHATLFACMFLPLRFQSSESPDETGAAGTLRRVPHSQVAAVRSGTSAKIQNEFIV